MYRLPLVQLVTALGLVSGGEALAQVAKPGLPSTGESDPAARLAAPAKISAAQRLDGRIYVVWNAVEDASGYHLIRSVPPTAAAPVRPQNPGDTVYIDADVTPGKTYYYQVDAINQAGGGGLKVGATPVKALSRSELAPTNITAVLNGDIVTVSWKASLPDLRYLIERVDFQGSTPLSPVPIGNPNCCMFSQNLTGAKPGARLGYQVTAMDQYSNRSAAASNIITVPPGAVTDTSRAIDTTAAADTTAPIPPATASTNVRPAVVDDPSRIRVGDPALKLGRSSAFTSLGLKRPHWVSLYESVATVDSQGQVRAVAPGFTYIVVTGVAPDKAVASMVKRIDVSRAR